MPKYSPFKFIVSHCRLTAGDPAALQANSHAQRVSESAGCCCAEDCHPAMVQGSAAMSTNDIHNARTLTS